MKTSVKKIEIVNEEQNRIKLIFYNEKEFIKSICQKNSGKLLMEELVLKFKDVKSELKIIDRTDLNIIEFIEPEFAHNGNVQISGPASIFSKNKNPF